MAKTIRPPKRLILQPPLVPVIDVVFNLLIFFMCIPNAAAGAGSPLMRARFSASSIAM